MVIVEVVDGKMKKPGPPVEPGEIKKRNRRRREGSADESLGDFKNAGSMPLGADV